MLVTHSGNWEYKTVEHLPLTISLFSLRKWYSLSSSFTELKWNTGAGIETLNKVHVKACNFEFVDLTSDAMKTIGIFSGYNKKNFSVKNGSAK